MEAAPQHIAALERANRVRLARAATKRKVASGELSAADVVEADPWEMRSALVFELLMSQHRWGRARCRRTLLALGLPESKRMGTLTDRQRTALAAVLRTAQARRLAASERYREGGA
jgi:hypothetical protein